jgi:HD-GYP domain-containing protein (c-di-GMP phosphodiesterase class II)
MMDTKELLKRISALRQRLDQTRESAGAAAATLMQHDAPAHDPMQALAHKVESGSWETILLNDTMRQLPDLARPGNDNDALPSLLTSRGIRLLKRGKELLHEMRSLAEDPALISGMHGTADEQEPLSLLHRDILAVTEVVVRTIQVFPSAPSSQMRLCEGLEGILAMVDEKLSVLKSGLSLRRKEQKRIDFLAEVLANILNGSPSALESLKPLAVEISSEARQGQALRFLYAPPTDRARFVAAHSLNLAQVLGRVLHHDSDWQSHPEEPLLTAFIHDIGMILVPSDILNVSGPLSDEQRRFVERHALLGAEVAARLWPDGGPQVDAIANHHERNDGTGYPAGRSYQNLSVFSRLFAVCDVYAALCARRPYRPALDSRAALTDTLMLANQGVLDRDQAERLLALSYHPVGSVVELNDGSFAAVVAVQPATTSHGTGTANPSAPIVSLLTDSQGFPLPIPRLIDLSQDKQRTIVRNLLPQDRRRFMLKRYPEMA